MTLEELELRLETLEKRPPLMGPAGSVEAATIHANKTVSDAEQRLQESCDMLLAKFHTEIDQLRAEFAVLKASLAETINTTVENHTVQVLEHYGVVSDFDHNASQ